MYPIIPRIMSITISLISSSLPGNKIAELSAIATHICQGIILGIWSINIEMIAIIFNFSVFIIIPQKIILSNSLHNIFQAPT